MACIQVRDVPDHIYRMLVDQARKEGRNLAQQVVAVLARGLEVSDGARTRTLALIETIRWQPVAGGDQLSPLNVGLDAVTPGYRIPDLVN